jgi:hypothetical protein
MGEAKRRQVATAAGRPWPQDNEADGCTIFGPVATVRTQGAGPFDESFASEPLDAVFNITRIRDAIRAHPKRFKLIAIPVLEAAERQLSRYADLDEEHAATLSEAELRRPVIGVKFGNGTLLIDGYHRLHRHAALGTSRIACWQLTLAQAKAFRVRTFKAPPGTLGPWTEVSATEQLRGPQG